MTIEAIPLDDFLLVKVEGIIDMFGIYRFQNIMNDLMERYPLNIVMDLSSVDSIDSAGIGVILSIYKKQKNANRKLILLTPKEGVEGIFKLAKINKHVPIVHSLEDAKKLF